MRRRRERPLARGQGGRGAADARLRPRLQLLPVPGHGRPDHPARAAAAGDAAGDREAAGRLRARQAARSGSSPTTSATRCTLDLGISQRTRQPVWDEIKDALPWTLLLVGTGHAAGDPDRHLAGGDRRDAGAARSTDDGLLGFSLFTYAAPEYWIGIILILVFAVWIPIFPAGPADDARGGVLQLVRQGASTSPTTWCCRRPR